MFILFFTGAGLLGLFPNHHFMSLDAERMSSGERLLDIAHHCVLPVLCLAFAEVAYISRQMRSSLLEVIRQDYIRTARAKGLPERRVIYRHALRNGLIPIVTL